MKVRFAFAIAIGVVLSVPVPSLSAEVMDQSRPPETSRALRITIPKFVQRKHDLEIILLHRDGYFHNGYARLPGRDNLVHRVDPDPANPFEYVYKDGGKPDISGLSGTYAYKNPAWRKLYNEYESGKLVIRYLKEIPPLSWDEKAGTLKGTVEVWILPVDESNHWGLSAPGNISPWRLQIDAARRDGKVTGKAEAWTYPRKDMSLGMEAERKGFALSARWDEDYWKPAPNSEYAKGHDWPQVRGPHLTGAAIDCGKPLVDDLHNARLLWVAEEPIGGGKGGKPKVAFGFYPANFSGWGYAAYAAPVVADGRVYLYVLHPDRKQARTDPALQQNVLVRRGADPEIVANAHHAVFCFDARTGRTLWRWISASTSRRASSGKQGVGLTPCYLDGKLYVRVGGITCFDGKSGEILWQKSDRAYATVGGWSHEESLVSVGGVLLAPSRRADLVGVDPKTGKKLWEHQNVTGSNQLATQMTLDGKAYIVVARGNGGDEKSPSDPSMFFIDPRTGKVLWTEDSVGFNSASLLVDGKIVCGNVSPPPAERTKDTPRHTGGFRLSLDGAKRIWTSQKTAYPGQRATPVAHDGYFYIDSRGSGFQALNAQTGKVVNQHPHIYAMTGGDHNWTWHIATDDRVITSGCLLFSTGEQGFKRLPGRLSLDLVGGYKCPVKPAIADGRLFVRTMNRLLCYDLRKPRATEDRRE